MQKTMILDPCARCGQPIAPGEPAMQTASVDIIGGRAVSSPVKSYHLPGRCHDDAKRRGSPSRTPLRQLDSAASGRPRSSCGTRLFNQQPGDVYRDPQRRNVPSGGVVRPRSQRPPSAIPRKETLHEPRRVHRYIQGGHHPQGG